MGQSKLFPKWLRPQSLLPHWLGQSDTGEPNIATPRVAELVIEVLDPTIITEVLGGASSISTSTHWSPSITEFIKKKINLKVNFVTLEQGDDVVRVKKHLKRQTFLKPKYPPTAVLNNIEFKEETDD